MTYLSRQTGAGPEIHGLWSLLGNALDPTKEAIYGLSVPYSRCLLGAVTRARTYLTSDPAFVCPLLSAIVHHDTESFSRELRLWR